MPETIRMFTIVVAIVISVALAGASCAGSDSPTTESAGQEVEANADVAPASEADADQPDDEGSQDEDSAAEPQSGGVPAPVQANPFEMNDDLTQRPTVDPDLLGDLQEFVISDIVIGDGEEATAGRIISMQYVGVLQSDGTPFDASWDRGQPFEFQLGNGQVISGWDQGIEGMRVGGRRILQIPSDLAYGPTARSEVIGANADLLFIVDLIGMEPLPEPAPPIPDDALGPVDSLSSSDLVVGDGATPEPGDIVTVEFVGVTAVEGVERDSTWSSGALPFRFAFERSLVFGGWTEEVAGMRVGGERIVKVPADQAIGEDDMVYRVHLVDVESAPELHKLSFSGPPPDDVEVTTLTEGTGAGAEAGQSLQANLVVYYYNNTDLITTSYLADQPASLQLMPDDDEQNLNNALLGIKLGETRQIILPPAVAYPDGIPPGDPLTEDDGVVVVLEVLEIS